jgi:Ca2+-binding EF-hand superfamily protein
MKTPYHYKDALRILFENIRKDIEAFILRVFDNQGRIDRNALNTFMKEVGEPLDMDFTGNDFDWDYEMSEEEKATKLKRLEKLVLEVIYRKTVKG